MSWFDFVLGSVVRETLFLVLIALPPVAFLLWPCARLLSRHPSGTTRAGKPFAALQRDVYGRLRLIGEAARTDRSWTVRGACPHVGSVLARVRASAEGWCASGVELDIEASDKSGWVDLHGQDSCVRVGVWTRGDDLHVGLQGFVPVLPGAVPLLAASWYAVVNLVFAIARTDFPFGGGQGLPRLGLWLGSALASVVVTWFFFVLFLHLLSWLFLWIRVRRLPESEALAAYEGAVTALVSAVEAALNDISAAGGIGETTGRDWPHYLRAPVRPWPAGRWGMG